MVRRFLSIGMVAVAFCLTVGRSDAAPDPRAFVGDLGTQGIQMLGPNVAPEQRVARFRQLFQSDFDVSGIARFAAGRYWRAFSPEQQQEYLQLFQEYTVQAYSTKLGEYGGGQFNITGSQNAGDETIVDSEIARANGQPVQIDWHVIDEGGQNKITDVYVDRVSMKVTQRDEFAKIIENNGGQPSALLAVLRQELRSKQQPTPVR
jgi:phospholipid transport system substrate-binding protein